MVKPASSVFLAFATPTTVQKLSVNSQSAIAAVVRIRGEMRMHVDQSGQQRHSLQDRRGARPAARRSLAAATAVIRPSVMVICG